MEEGQEDQTYPLLRRLEEGSKWRSNLRRRCRGRVRELEEKIFHPFLRMEENREELGQEEEDGSGKLDNSSESEVESSENFSDEEDEESYGESFVKYSSPEEHAKKIMIKTNDNFEDATGGEESGAKNFLEE
ncbi:hypothetical protein L2E82_24912 [Cichorium intybus]|uniref:Uncharacterized protein n=1 Tax=Cichorium intybus TaxID=13427 RepID=A0ACB9E269_CICIN|nr:hypothetical protein L2E82_24912 [Cichorium intybus]